MQLGSLSPDLHSFPHILLDVFLSIISKMAKNDPQKKIVVVAMTLLMRWNFETLIL